MRTLLQTEMRLKAYAQNILIILKALLIYPQTYMFFLQITKKLHLIPSKTVFK